MLSLCFYQHRSDVPEQPDFRAEYTTDGFRELITVGLFKVPHTNVTSTIRGIDLRIFRIRVEAILSSCSIPHPDKQKLLSAARNFNFMVGNQ